MRRRERDLYLVFKVLERLEHSWRPPNGGMTPTLVFRGERFVDGSYVPRFEPAEGPPPDRRGRAASHARRDFHAT